MSFYINGSSFTEEQWYDLDVEAEEVAESHGCVVVLPKENQLQLDIDSEAQYMHFLRRKGDAENFLTFKTEITPSKSGLPNRHVTLTFEEGKVFTEWERICLQYFFGSDPIREDLNVLRKLAGHENPTRLFELKQNG